MASPIFFTPLYKERVWGGTALKDKLSRDLPEGKVIGESWEIVDRPDDQSVIVNGEYQGLTIREAIEKHGADIMGPDYDTSLPFPVLIKWLDCQQELSLQVHPPASVAGKLKGEPKTENWYIADVDEGAELMVGLKDGVTREQFEVALKEGTLEPLVHKAKVQSGDSIFVWSGRIHAIAGGNFILEIQQNSDTTYRVYDWGRVGLDGTPRDLHIDQSMESIAFDDYEPEPLRNTQIGDILADCDEFRILKEGFSGDKILEFGDATEPVLLNVVNGEIYISADDQCTYVKGDTILLPYKGTFSVSGSEGAEILITDHFA